MTKNITIELTLRQVEVAQSDDTAGYFTLIEKPAPQLGSQPTVALPAVQVRLPLPDLGPERAIWVQRGDDVQGFRWPEKQPNEEQGGGPGNPWGDLATLGKAVGDAFASFGGTFQNPALLAYMQDLKTWGL